MAGIMLSALCGSLHAGFETIPSRNHYPRYHRRNCYHRGLGKLNEVLGVLYLGLKVCRCVVQVYVWLFQVEVNRGGMGFHLGSLSPGAMLLTMTFYTLNPQDSQASLHPTLEAG